MSYVIHPLLLGKQTFNKGLMTYFIDYDVKIWIPLVAWYIHAGDTDILVDTGIAGQDLNRYLFGNTYEEYQTIENALEKRGSNPERIR